MASKPNGTLYIGVTSHLVQRVYQHKHKLIEGFTKQHGITQLVYYELCDDISGAIVREKRLKKYPRAWKINLIRSQNPDWQDLYSVICGENDTPPASASKMDHPNKSGDDEHR